MAVQWRRRLGHAVVVRLVVATLVLLSAAAAAHAAGQVPTGKLIEKVPCVKDPSLTYTLYLPSAYTPDRTWPTLVILDPGGRSVYAAELFRDAAETYGWILMAWDFNPTGATGTARTHAINALLPDAAHRFATNPKRMYLAGFSVGAMLSWATATQTGMFAGVISSGGRMAEGQFSDATSFASFGTAGTTDFNYRDMRRIDAIFADKGLPHRLEIFDGPHSWMPKEMALQAVEWMELVAMKEGLRPRDDTLVARLYAADLAAGRALEGAGDALAAMRHYDAVVATFDGLHDVGEPRARADKLRGSTTVHKALKEERTWESWEDDYLAGMWRTLALLGAKDTPAPTKLLVADLRIAKLKKYAEAPGVEGITARRLLALLWTRTSYSMVTEFLAAGRYAAAEQSLTVAAAIREDSPILWYNLACTRARQGRTEEALAALDTAVDRGFHDAVQMQRDADLESLRATPRFQALLAKLGSSGAAH